MVNNSNNAMMEKLLKFLKENDIDLSALNEMLNADTFLMAWNHTEIEQPSYTFKEAISWIKEHFDPKLHTSASITKEVSQDGTIILNCCLISKEGEPLAEPKDPFLRVETKEICQDLKDNFGDKNMIVIK